MRTHWSVEVLQGTKKQQVGINLQFVIWGQMHKWRQYIKPTEYKGKKYAHELRSQKITEDLRNRRDMRTKTALQFPESWVSVWLGYCDLWLDKGDYVN